MPISRAANKYVTNQTTLSVTRSKFDVAFEHKTTASSGYWFPIFCKETLPGDTWQCNVKELVRQLTPAVPVMDNAVADIAAFFVPNRLCTIHEHDWEKCCGSDEPEAWEQDYEKPDLISTGNVIDFKDGSPVNSLIQPMSLANYLGLPIMKTGRGIYKISSLPFVACFRIWNEWLRNQNVSPSVDLSDVPNMAVAIAKSLADSDNKLLRAYKLKDYFTSALPAPQKGNAVLVPVGDKAPVLPENRVNFNSKRVGMYMRYLDPVEDNVQPATPLGNLVSTGPTSSPTDGNVGVSNGAVSAGFTGVYPANLWADLSAATGASVNQIRMSFALQRLYEKLARGGSRYNEFIKAIFDVDAPVGLLQMSEFIGGGTFNVTITPVVQTSESTSQSPLGALGGYSNSFDDGVKFTKSCVEYGYIVVMMTLRPQQSYSQGVPLMFRRYDPQIDFYSPTFAHIGEQPIYTEEIYSSNTSQRYDSKGAVVDPKVFGYKEAWVEYKTGSTQISGNLAPDAGDETLTPWTYTTDFDEDPTLSESFLQQDSAQIGDTLIDTTTKTQFLIDAALVCTLTRPMPVNSVPGLVDHF